MKIKFHMSILNVFSYFEYLKKQLHNLDVISKPITVHMRIDSLLWDYYQVSSEMSYSEQVYCVTVAFTMTGKVDCSCLVPEIWAKHYPYLPVQIGHSDF